MKIRLMVFTFLAIAFSTSSHATIINGELSTSDAIAEDPWGNFHYDMYYLTVNNTAEITVTLTPAASLAAWLGYWDADFSASPDYFVPPPEGYASSLGIDGTELSLSFEAFPDIEYQIMVATWAYNPVDLGSYSLEILDLGQTSEGFQVATQPMGNMQSVPAPASWLVLVLGLVILGFVNRWLPANLATTTVRCKKNIHQGRVTLA